MAQVRTIDDPFRDDYVAASNTFTGKTADDGTRETHHRPSVPPLTRRRMAMPSVPLPAPR